MEFKDFFVMALIMGLFIFGIIYVAIAFGTENNTSVNINNNPFIMKIFGNISQQLNSTSETSNNAMNAYITDSANPTVTALGFTFSSILNAGNLFIKSIINMFIAMFTLPSEVLGIPPIISGTIMAIVVGLLILAVWSLVRAGR